MLKYPSLLLSILLLLSWSATPTIAHAQHFYYGALAVGNHSGHVFGVSIRHNNATQASLMALLECGVNCSVVATFSAGCIAYASNDAVIINPARGWSMGYSRVEAELKALYNCNVVYGGGGACSIKTWACN